MIEHLNIHVVGKVQGVFYRASAKHQARELGVNGFVRNEPDGSVYLEAEGTKEQLDILINWCRQGPPHSQVRGVTFNSARVQHFEKFEIRK